AAGVPAATKEVVDRDGGLTVPNANGVKIPNTNVLVVTYQFPDVTTGAEVQVNADLKSDNYDVTCEKAICKLVVLQDEATDVAADAENGNYRISGTLGKKVGDIQWYTSVVTISPVIQHAPDYYNLIREEKSPEWVKELVINDESSMNGHEIQFTMKNSRTGAYTTDSDKMTFYVDSEAPKIDGEVTFTASSKASVLDNIGYFLEYGNFFKEDVTATMTITDNKSGCARIYYKVNNAEKWTEQELNGEESDTVSINIPLGTKSELLFYLEDVAGKTSEVTRLVGKNGGQEWVIENTDPQIVGYHIANLDGDRISNLSSGNWYNQPIQVVAEVKESDSGIHFADWYVNGDVDRKTLEDGIHRGDSSSYVELPYTFKDSGIYGVSLDVTDNATNTSGKSELTTVRIDLAAPVIHMDENVIPDIWTQVVEIPFTVTDDISGVYKVSAVAPNGDSFELQPAKDGTYTLKATMAGDYTIYARDEAYNEATKTLTFDKISTEVPKNGSVSISPEIPDGTNGWYVTKPTVTITPAEDTGRVPVTTYCKLWSGDAEPAEATQITAMTQMRVPQDGIWHLRVWTETASGVKTETEYAGLLYVDSTAPECMVTKVVPDSTQQVVTFTVSDAVSGVDANRIRVVNGKTTVSSKVAALSDGKGYQGTFVVSSPGNYVVEVYDAAGNLSNTAAYQPMTMKVNTIRDITKTTATVSNITYRGTYPIASVKYEYKKASAKSYKTVTPYLVKDVLGNVTASYSFKNLKSNTKYEYRITSVSALGEALTYTGSFKTAGAEGINVSGKVVDADNANAKITVSLMEGNTVLQTTEIKSGKSFVFTKVPDGNYNITATNGITSKTVSVNIYKGKVIDPTGDILITLRSGMIATVLINGSKTPGISVSGLDDIFAYDTVNFTDADKQFIAEGGTVEFRLNVEYKTSGAISQSTLKALYKLMDDDEKADMYLDLSLTKIRTYASGVIESKKSVTQLSGGVTLKITVPLSSKVIKAAQKSVIRVHNNTAKILRDLDKSANSYTLETNRFSTYVITYKTTGGTGDTTPGDNKPNDNKPGNDGGKGGKDNSDKTVKVYDSSPKTGDEAPLAAMGGILMISLAGIVVLKKKYK
ncbi:MAG: LPXTG cell wall anchor domain-containing protein, partial [Lachnospiraceae bacterium]|nr:LPXTG cell wall anchor domain-containing protein [Lachnospiraceae bacterium]